MLNPFDKLTNANANQPGLALFEETKEQREQNDHKHRLSLLKTSAGVLSCIPLPLALVNWFATKPNYAPGTYLVNPIIFLAVVATLLFVLGFLLVQPGISRKRADLIAFYLLGVVLVSLTSFSILLGADGSANGALLAMFLYIPLLAGIFGLSVGGIFGLTAVAVLLILVTYCVTALFNIVPPVVVPEETPVTDLVIWMIVLAVGGFWVSVITNQARKAQANLLKRMDQLGRLTSVLKATNAFGSTLSRELAGMTADLHVTSRQQAANSQEQVAAVTEVTTSLEELNETANQIASSASAAAISANHTVDIATQVRDTSVQARSTSEEGNQAVDQAIASVERVRNRIELLGQRLLHLTEQTRKVGTIIDIIDEIADETHLLALNASIEAAGSIHTQGGEAYRSLRGDRFGVIAQEVKNLADRSRESTEEVRQAITEMQGAVAAAVLVAEEGKKETSAALSRSQIAGAVIDKLNEIINGNASQADEILNAVEEVNIRCDEISIATGQQRSANQQILYTMRTVAQVSQESAGAVSVLSDTVSLVNRHVDQLNATLEKSNASMLVAAN
ncbi:MAG: hypothetical protein J0I20_36350 [Chloroflexi bacterium]|nr:hypothetical protein [Chloroflexota bacterium]OJW05513.1 MAG: hypothetical protein BGO39_08805 [Chloroflexi bacterium 54-19]